MTQLTSDLDIVVHGATGATLKINAGTIKEVPDQFLELALAAGAYKKGSTPTQTNDDTNSGDVIKEAIAALLEDGNPNNFDRKNKPKLTPLSELVGFKVTTAMRDAALVE